MSHGRAVLKSITNRDYRKQIECLLDEGWDAARTGKNHLRLSHPNAHKDVISSGTPSDYRATENLKAQCRRALLPPAGDVVSEKPFAILKLPAVVEDARSRRKPRWNEAERKDRKARKDTSFETPMMPVMALPLKTTKPDLANLNETVHQSLLADAEARKQERKTAEAEKLKKQPRRAKPEIAKNEADYKDSKQMTVAAAPAEAATPILSLVTEAPAAAPVVAPAPVGCALPVLSADLLSVAMRMLSGELRSITITPDMVGKSLVLGGEAWVVDGSLPQVGALQAPAPVKAVAAAAVAPADAVIRGFIDDEPIMVEIREVFETIEDNWLRLADVLALVSKGDGVTDRGHKENIRRRLNHMVGLGQIERKQEGVGARAPMMYRKAG